MSKIPDALDEPTIARLRAFIARHGERQSVVLLRVSHSAIQRAAAGFGIRAATAEVIRLRLAEAAK